MIKTYHGRSLWVCPACGNREYRSARYVPVPEERRAFKGQEERLAEICGKALQTDPPISNATCAALMVWTPESAAHDLLGESFTVDLDGKQIKLSSLHELRTLENLSLRKTANGDGSPSVFRQFSQDRSNRDVNVFKGTSYEKSKQIPFERKTHAGPIDAKAVPADKHQR